MGYSVGTEGIVGLNLTLLRWDGVQCRDAGRKECSCWFEFNTSQVGWGTTVKASTAVAGQVNVETAGKDV